MIKKYVLSLFFAFSFCMVVQADGTQKESIDDATRSFTFEDESRAFAGPQSSTNFASETLFSLSDFGRKTFHAYRSTNYRLTRLVNYQPLAAATPANEASSSPMIKVTASSVTIDLNGFVVSRQDTDVEGAATCNAVGIEVGYSPYDKYNGRFGLTAGTAANNFVSVAQPEYVTIRNGTIDNFGIGIVVHAGVKNLTLENVTISNAALGIVYAGQSNKPITSVFLKNVRIVGDGTDRSAVLEWAKAKLENSNVGVNTGQMMYGSVVYNAAAGATTLVPLQADPVTAETNLRIYSGIVMLNTNNANIEQVGCTALGINTAAEVTVNTATFGIYAQNCNGLQLTDVDVSNNTSQRLVAGLNCQNCSAVTLKNIISTNNHITIPAAGALTPATTFGLWASGAWLTYCNNLNIDGLNVSKTVGATSILGSGGEGTPTASEKSTAMGLYLFYDTAAQIKNVQADYLDAGITTAGYAYGVYAGSMLSCEFDGVSASYISGDASTDIDNTDGSCVGMYFTGSGSNITLKNINTSNNNSDQEYSKVYGISLAASGTFSTWKFVNVQANNNQNYGDAVGIYVGPVVSNFSFENIEANGMVATDDDVARGIYFNNAGVGALTTHHVTLKNVSCSNQVGIDRAEGIKFSDGQGFVTIRSVNIDGLVANNNRASAEGCYARGLYFDESLVLAADITVKNAQCSNHEATDGAGGANDAIGIDFGCPVESLILENIVANNQRGDEDAYGIQFESGATVKSAVLKNIQVNNISKLSAAVDGIVAGISFGDTVDTIQILGGSSSNNNGPDVAGSGKRARVYGIVFEGYAQTGVISDWVSNRHIGFDEVAGIKFAGTEVDSFTLRNVQANYNHSQNDATYDTLTLYGIYFACPAFEIIMHNVQANNQFSWGYVYGIQFDFTAYGAYFTDVQCNSNWSSYVSAFGCRFAQGLQGGSFKNFTANSNTSEYDSDSASPFVDQTTVVGLYIKNAQGVHFDTVTCSSNTGSDILLDISTVAPIFVTQTTPGSWNMVQSAGVWLVNPTAITMKDVSCNYNTLHNTRRAAYTFGLLLDNPISVDIDGLSCSGNAGNAHVSGVFVNGGSSISLKNAVCSDNVQQGTYIGGTGETPRVYATVDTRVVTITPNGNISKHTVLPDAGVDEIGWVTGQESDGLFDAPESLKGAFGIFIKDAQDITLDTVTASKQSGFRAFGIELLDCSGVQMTDCVTSMQSATGDLFLDNADSDTVGLAANEIAGEFGTSGCAVTIPALYLDEDSVAITPDIFGIDFNPVVDVINVQATTQQMLDSAKLLKDAPASNEIINNVETMYGYHKSFVESTMLARAAVAKVRAWGVAVGTQIQNCSNVQIDNLISSGNSAEKDSAYGLLFANRCSDCKVRGGQFNSNQAWTDSQLIITPGTANGVINISQMNPFWGALDVDLPNPVGAGYLAYTVFDDDLEEWVETEDYGYLRTQDATNGRFTLRLIDDSTTKELCMPCGPIAAGIVIGDTSQRVEISDVVCAGNQGNAGQAYGIMHDVSAASVVQNAQLFQNMANMCGISYGLAEFNPQSSSVQLGNTAFGNQFHTFVDSNYMVPFNPVEPWNLEFPLKVGYNGNITDLANASPYDNVELRFIFNAPTDPTLLPDGVASDWLSGGLMNNITADTLAGEMSATSNVANDGPFVDINFTDMIVYDPIGGWTVHVDIHHGYTVNLNQNNQVISLSNLTDDITVSLRREGFEDITQDLVMTGTVQVDVSPVGIVTFDSGHFDLIGPDGIDINIDIDALYVTNITARNITLALDTAITNTGTDQSTIVLEPTDGIATMTTIGGVDIVTTALSFAASNVFDWDDTTNRSISGTATMIGAGDTTIAGSGSVVINQFGDVTSCTGTLTATVGGALVATLTVTGLSNESYSGYNPASRTAAITLDYAQDSNSTLIDSPVLGALSSNIFVGYALTDVSLSGSADPGYGTNEQAIAISGTGTLGALGGVTISGNVYVGTDANGIPNPGETASTLTVVHTATSTTVATITISGFTFNGDFVALLASGVNTITGAWVNVNSWDGGGSTIDAQVTGLASSGEGSLTLRGWTLTFTNTFDSGVANFPDNVGNGAIGASGVVTISDGLGTSYTGVTISGTVYVYADNVFTISDLASNHGGSASSASGTVGGQNLTINIGNITVS